MKQAGVVLLLLGGMGTAGAALLPAVNGQVYDDVLEISWLEDANFVKTSCDANNALWQAFEPTAITGNSGRSKAQICDDDNGRLNWNEAEGWIAVLNANNHLGHSDWRQWQVPDPTNDPDCSVQDFDGVGSDRGFGCTGSELGNLFNVTLGNPNGAGCSPNCLVNTGPFSNFQSFWYWSGTVYAPSPSNAWHFFTSNGDQRNDFVIFLNGYVWPVRPGQDVGAPAPASIPVLPWWGLMLMGLGLAAVARRRLR